MALEKLGNAFMRWEKKLVSMDEDWGVWNVWGEGLAEVGRMNHDH
jgi:hypothetical protein